jgi:hypothetical protein
MLQWHMLAAPEYGYDFAAIGAPGLASEWAVVRATLAAHGGLTVAACGGLLAAAVRQPLWTRYCAR